MGINAQTPRKKFAVGAKKIFDFNSYFYIFAKDKSLFMFKAPITQIST